MPKQKTEETKKHGDKLEKLIERTGASSAGGASPGKSGEQQDDPDELQDDDEDVENDSDDTSIADDGDDEYVEERNARAAAELYEERLYKLAAAYRVLVSAPPRRWH